MYQFHQRYLSYIELKQIGQTDDRNIEHFESNYQGK